MKNLNVKTDENGVVIGFDIERKYWKRGKEAINGNALLNPDSTMCCLGFYSRACGLSSDDILEVPMPSEVSELPTQMLWLVNEVEWESSASAHDLANTNDTSSFIEEEREEKIKAMFARQGIEVNFV